MPTQKYFRDIAKTKKRLFDIIGYTPHEGQREFHASMARFKTLRCGRRAGKTTCGPLDKIHLIATPGSRGWIVAPDYKLGEKEFRVVWDALFGGNLFPNSKLKNQINMKKSKRINNPLQGQMYLSIVWAHDIAYEPKLAHLNLEPQPSEIIVKSADNPGGLLGEELDWLVMAEVGNLRNSLAIWDRFLRMCLSSRNGEAVFPSTSYGGISDLLDMMYDMGQDPKNKNYKSWQWPSFINPGWSKEPENELAELKKMSPEAYEEQVLGERVTYAGRFYKEFSADKHIATINLDIIGRMYRSWDFGYRHPCIGWFQINKRDQVCWLYTYLGADLDDIDLVWIGKYLSGEYAFQSLPFNIRELVRQDMLIPFIPIGEALEFQDVCDSAGVQQKSSADSAIKVMYSQGIYPRYEAEKTQRGEREPESISIARNLLKIRPNGEAGFLVDKDNALAKEMLKGLAYEERTDGVPTHKFKRDGYLEHIADVFKYFCLNVMKYSLYTDKKRAHIKRELISYV